MSSLLMTSGSVALEFDSLLSLVNHDDKYLCARCHRILKNPKQTSCGHRICQPCTEILFVDESVSVPCPAGEPDCHMLNLDQIFPDYSVVREIKGLLVYCIYKNNGCKDKMMFDKLKDHVQSCKFGFRVCSHCSQQLNHSQVDDHEESCPKRVYACKFQKYGCDFQAVKTEIVKHESDPAVHFETVLNYVAALEDEKELLSKEQKNLRNDLNIVTTRLADCLRENSSLTTSVKQLKESQLHSESQTTSLQQRLSVHEATCEEHRSSLMQKLADNEASICLKILNNERQRSPGSTGNTDDLRKQLDMCRQQIRGHTDRLSDYELRFQCLETTNYDGVLIWKIGDYEQRKRQAEQGQILSLYSQPFYTSRYGYKMCARVYLNGDGVGKGAYMSLFFVIMQGDYDDLLTWPFRQRVTMMLLDQKGNRRHVSDTFRPDQSSNSFQKPTAAMNVASGCPKFISHAALEDKDSLYMRNNYIYVKIVVDTSDLVNP